MEFYAFNPTKIRTLHVDPGEDILSSVEQFFAEANLKQAVVLGGYGAMAAYHLNSPRQKVPVSVDEMGEFTISRLIFG